MRHAACDVEEAAPLWLGTLGTERNSDIAFNEINHEFEPQVQQANRWADQAQRDKICLYGEMELRNRLFQENHDIEEWRRICCEETDRARQARIEQLSMHQPENFTIVNQGAALERPTMHQQENFTILNQGAALERPTFPVEPLLF